jgi:RimJ/RimL family protein N-acetyltransferase
MGMPKAATGAGGNADGVVQWLAQHYPRDVELAHERQVQLRLMGEEDVAAVLAFANTLAPDELMFLRVNITEPPVVERWVESIRAGRTVTVLAREDEKVVGEATLRHNEATWTRHLGEIRIQISPSARRCGLARLLAGEIDTIARHLGLQLLTARMTLDQSAAQAVFRQLGFQREAVLWDYSITPDGQTRDVLVATKRL